MEIAVASTIPTEQIRHAGAMNFLVDCFRNGHPVTATPSHTELQTLALKRTAWYPNSQVMRLEPILRKMTDAQGQGRVLLKVPAPLYAVCHGLRTRGALLTDR